MEALQLRTPVAFLIFNRPETTARVFEAIRQVRPPKLLVVADGPRAGWPRDAENCEATRAIIHGVDWPCDVLTNYSDMNLGCKRRVSSGLDWVFDTVEEAIILEDDCLPHPTFFRFCEELLGKYRDDERVMMISGTNVVGESGRRYGSYFYSKYPHIWGWASWRRAWQYYDVHMTRWPGLRNALELFDLGSTRDERKFWMKCFDRVFEGTLNTWDAQVTFMLFCQHGLTIFPHDNLISNIGFGVDATHTHGINALANLQTYEMQFPLNHPDTMVRHVQADKKRQQLEYSHQCLLARIAGKVRRNLNLMRRGSLSS